MRCDRVRELFGAYWDDETTQAERERLEVHFAACGNCRVEYEDFSRALELTGALPRVEAAPDLLERVVARTRRSPAVPDRVAHTRPRWQVVGAAAALVLVAGVVFLPSLRTIRQSDEMTGTASSPLREPVLVSRTAEAVLRFSEPVATNRSDSRAPGGGIALLADSVFDHSEDVEFILDPVTVRRGHAHAVTSAPTGVRVERAVVSF